MTQQDDSNRKNKRVLVVDDHPIFAGALAEMIGSIEGYQVIGIFYNGQSTLDFLAKHTADLVLLDINMPGMNGIELSRRIKAAYPETWLVAVTGISVPDVIHELYQLNIQGFLPKSLTLKETARALSLIQSGATYFGREMITLLLEYAASPEIKAEKSNQELFSDREMQIINGICLQKTSKEIAYSLNISIKTIEIARKQIMQKMNCVNIAGIVIYAIQHKLITIAELNQQFN